MKNNVSCIHSLASPFDYRPSVVGGFEHLGYGPQGEYHITVSFRNIVSSIIHVDVKNPVVLTKNAAVYELVGAKGSLYGLLFALNLQKSVIKDTHLVVEGDKAPSGDFAPIPVSPSRYSVQLFLDSSDTLLVNRCSQVSDLVVVDE